jgi:hypothetical protein
MELPPFRKELLLVFGYDPERLSGVGSAHVMVLPKGRRCLGVAQEDEDLSAVIGLDVHMRRLMFSRRRVNVDLKAALIVGLDHERS